MMPRVPFWYTKEGRERYNTDRPLIPFELMKNIGDWCEVERGPKCLAGNVAGLCSKYSLKLGRRFQFKDRGDGVFLIKVVYEPVIPKIRRRKK
jgi:hypothetical protein